MYLIDQPPCIRSDTRALHSKSSIKLEVKLKIPSLVYHYSTIYIHSASAKPLPCERVPLVVWRARRVNALVTSSHVEAHPVYSTLDVLLQTLVNICAYRGKEAACRS